MRDYWKDLKVNECWSPRQRYNIILNHIDYLMSNEDSLMENNPDDVGNDNDEDIDNDLDEGTLGETPAPLEDSDEEI